MSKLKLFVSHSSRLDDIDHNYADIDHNWCLLKETCEQIRHYYGEDRVEVLVDKNGLIPGNDWEYHLNTWLAECHVAIILCSKRAIEKSNWVAKEAAILSWRRELDPNFTLIPVCLKGETTAEDLSRGFLSTLKINKSQCIRDAATAADILAGLVQKLGNCDNLCLTYPQTPLERLQEGFAELLSSATENSLKNALQALGLTDAPKGDYGKRGWPAGTLAKHILTHSSSCCDRFRCGLEQLDPEPSKEHAERLFKYVRPLWVDPGAAASIPAALEFQSPLALNGQFVSLSDPFLETENYTLERYIERSWPRSRAFLIVPVESTTNIAGVKKEIHLRIFGPDMPQTISENDLDQDINTDSRVIILFMHSADSRGSLPDSRLLAQLLQLHKIYQKLIILVSAGTEVSLLPDSVNLIQPPLKYDNEQKAFFAERRARTFLNQI